MTDKAKSFEIRLVANGYAVMRPFNEAVCSNYRTLDDMHVFRTAIEACEWIARAIEQPPSSDCKKAAELSADEWMALRARGSMGSNRE